MRSWGIAAQPALLLVGCDSDGEDFSIEVKRPAAAVYAPLSAADVGLAKYAFPGITFERSRPSDTEILYTVPGTASFPATVRLRLEPRTGSSGESTLIHASVDIPKVRAVIDGRPKELSERKVERQLSNLLDATRRSLEQGSSAQSQSAKLSSLLVAIAVGTNEKHLARALELKDSPAKLMELLLAFDSSSDQPEPDVDGREIRAVDPDAGLRTRDFAQARAERKREAALNAETAPTTDLSRYDR